MSVGRLGAERFRLGDPLMVVAVGDVEQCRVAAAGRAVQIGDAVGEFVEQLGVTGIIVAPWHRWACLLAMPAGYEF